MLPVLWRNVGKSLRHLAACGGITGQYTSTNGYIYCPIKDCMSNKENDGPYGANGEAAVKKHMSTKRSLQSDLICNHPGCNYVRPSKARLQDHMARHSLKQLKLYVHL